MMGVKVTPALVAELVAASPGRVVRKLDAAPELARAWEWVPSESSVTVTTDKGESVTVAGPVASSMDALSCTCLLAPRCLHLLAVVRLLDLDEGAVEAVESVAEAEIAAADVTEAQRDAARALWTVAGAVLSHGLHNTGAVVQADLLRAVHTCRSEGLHRGASAGLRLVQHARELRGRSEAFDLDAATGDLREALTVARLLGVCGTSDPAWLGVGRRAYAPVDVRRLTGLCTAPVVTRGGFGGVVTWLVDDAGRLWTLPHVMPAGTPGLTSGPAGAYEAPADLGELNTPHRALCRGALILSGATGSADRRLGRGKSVQAALGRRTDAPTVAAGEPLEVVDVVVLGASGAALAVARTTDGLLIRVVAPTDAPGVHFLHNLGLMARAPGLEASLVLERVDAREPTAVALALRSDTLSVPSEWGGLVNLGLDELQPSYFHNLGAGAAVADVPSPDPLVEARRRIARVVLGGARTLQAEARDAVDADSHRLARRMMPGGADVLRAMAASATGGEQSVTGQRRRADPEIVAIAWLAAATWCAAADDALRAASWSDVSGSAPS